MCQLEQSDPFTDAHVMSLAHRGSVDEALAELEARVKHDQEILYLEGDPFWDVLANEPRFLSIFEASEMKLALQRKEVESMIERGLLVLPGHIDPRAVSISH